MAAGFDTLAAARRLKEAGATDAVAEAIAETVRDARDFDLAQLATTADLAELRVEIERLCREIAGIELRLIRWVIGTVVAAFVELSGVIWAATQVILPARP